MRTHLLLALPFAVACGSASPDGTTNGDPNSVGSMPTDPNMGNMGNEGADGGAPMAHAAKLGDVGLAFTYACGSYADSIETRDVNKDGRADFLIACDHRPYLALGQADGSLALKQLPATDTGTTIIRIAFCDVDGDAFIDVCAQRWTQPTWFSVWQGKADGSFGSENTKVVVGDYSLKDVDGDGNADIVQTGKGNAFHITMTGLKPWFTSDVAWPQLVDSNGDGIKDLVGDDVRVALGTGPTSFSASTANYSGAYNAHVADFDRDGKLDVAIQVYSGGDDYIGFIRGDGKGHFSSTAHLQKFYRVGIVQVFDNGGVPCVFDTGASLRVFCSKNDFDFTNYVEMSSSLYRIQDARIGDVNGDGKLDVVVLGEVSDKKVAVNVLLGF